VNEENEERIFSVISFLFFYAFTQGEKKTLFVRKLEEGCTKLNVGVGASR
jgi:hypothetical protein